MEYTISVHNEEDTAMWLVKHDSSGRELFYFSSTRQVESIFVTSDLVELQRIFNEVLNDPDTRDGCINNPAVYSRLPGPSNFADFQITNIDITQPLGKGMEYTVKVLDENWNPRWLIKGLDDDEFYFKFSHNKDATFSTSSLTELQQIFNDLVEKSYKLTINPVVYSRRIGLSYFADFQITNIDITQPLNTTQPEGEEDMNLKKLMMLQMMTQAQGQNGSNNMLPLMMMMGDEKDGDDSGMEMMLMMSMMQNGAEGESNMMSNMMLPMMLMKKGSFNIDKALLLNAIPDLTDTERQSISEGHTDAAMTSIMARGMKDSNNPLLSMFMMSKATGEE